jgi:hypothetical protein
MNDIESVKRSDEKDMHATRRSGIGKEIATEKEIGSVSANENEAVTATESAAGKAEEVPTAVVRSQSRFTLRAKKRHSRKRKILRLRRSNSFSAKENAWLKRPKNDRHTTLKSPSYTTLLADMDQRQTDIQDGRERDPEIVDAEADLATEDRPCQKRNNANALARHVRGALAKTAKKVKPAVDSILPHHRKIGKPLA